MDKTCSKRSHGLGQVEEEDANISTFRRRNKLLLLLLLFLLFSLAIIIAALIREFRLIDRITSHTHHHLLVSPINEFCSVSDPPIHCLNAIHPITTNTLILHSDQIFTISLQAAADHLQNLTVSTDFGFSNCSNSLRLGLSQLGRPLATMRVNPFVGSLSAEQRGEIAKRIAAAEESVESCLDWSEGGGAAAAKVYLNSAKDFLVGYDMVLLKRRRIGLLMKSSENGIIYDNLFAISFCGLQLLFMFGMFCALFRIR